MSRQFFLYPESFHGIAIDWNKLEDASQEALQETAEEFQIPAPLNSGYAIEWGPIVDGDYMPSDPVIEESFAENGKDIELLIGSNLNEWCKCICLCIYMG